jgi:hypothetical protein
MHKGDAMTWPAYSRCPTDREDVEVRVRTVGADVVVQTYRPHGHDLAAPWWPTDAAVRVPRRYAARLAELILQGAAAKGAA